MNNSKFTPKVDWAIFAILAEKIEQFGSPGFSFFHLSDSPNIAAENSVH
jgi:hypothetical protein